MNELEQRLTEDLQRAAGQTHVPSPPVTELNRLGHRRAQRRRLSAVGSAVATVLAVAVGVALTSGMVGNGSVGPVQPGPVHATSTVSPSPGPDRTLDVGPPPTIPYWHAGVLHDNGITMHTPMRQIATANGVTVIGNAWNAHTARWFLVDGHALVPVVSSPGVSGLRLSPDGRLVVWERVQPHTTTVFAWDTRTRRLLGSRQVVIDSGCCSGPSLMLYGADSDGQVFYGDGRVLTAWNARTGAAHQVSGFGKMAPQPSKVTAFGLVFQARTGTPVAVAGVYGVVDDRGVFHRRGTVPSDQIGTWSPDGRRFAYPADSNGAFHLKEPSSTVAVLDVATGSRRIMHLPAVSPASLIWENPQILLLTGFRGPLRGDLVRCQTDTGHCQIALKLAGHPRDWAFPQGRG